MRLPCRGGQPRAADLLGRAADPVAKTHELQPQEARKILDDLEAGPVDKPAVDEEWVVVPDAVGDVRVRLVRPPGLAARASMEWFWDAYAPDSAQRQEITVSPNHATADQLSGLPPTLLLVDEADVLRDEGEAYAAKLRSAGVSVTTVRDDGTVHDFMLLDSLRDTRAARAWTAKAVVFLRAALGNA